MFNLSVYEAIEIINAIPEILIIALFYHRIFERKYNSYLPLWHSICRAFSNIVTCSITVCANWHYICNPTDICNIPVQWIEYGKVFCISLLFADCLYIRNAVRWNSGNYGIWKSF